MFLITVSKRLGGESWNLLTFNINLFSIKNVIFGYLGYPVLPWQRVYQGVLEIFWSDRSIFFLITKFETFLEVKSELIFEKKHPKIPLITKCEPNQSGGLSYEHLKFRPMHRLKYTLWRHNDVIVVTSKLFLLPSCRIHQAWHLCQILWPSEQ